ncbi:MAG: tetratricopeptide repeat protein, partial [Parvularcula sp.]
MKHWLAIAFVALAPMAAPGALAQDAPLQPIQSRDIGTAVAAMRAGDYATARALAEDLAAMGDPDAQYILGHIYQNGLTVEKDTVKAITYYVQAATSGQPNAQFALGELAYRGEGAVQDWDRAAQWYNLAAAQGHLLAKVRLGYMY